MSDPPTNIRALQAEQVLEVTWPESRVDRFPYLLLRSECPCATCRNEWTGERMLDPKSIRPDLKLTGMENIGTYAVQFCLERRPFLGDLHLGNIAGLERSQAASRAEVKIRVAASSTWLALDRRRPDLQRRGPSRRGDPKHSVARGRRLRAGRLGRPIRRRYARRWFARPPATGRGSRSIPSGSAWRATGTGARRWLARRWSPSFTRTT